MIVPLVIEWASRKLRKSSGENYASALPRNWTRTDSLNLLTNSLKSWTPAGRHSTVTSRGLRATPVKMTNSARGTDSRLGLLRKLSGQNKTGPDSNSLTSDRWNNGRRIREVVNRVQM